MSTLATSCTGGEPADDKPTPTQTPNLTGGSEAWRRLGVYGQCLREPGPDHHGAELTEKTFEDEHLVCARFDGARLVNVSFTRTGLALADFSESELVEVTFTGTSLAGAIFEKAHLRDVRFVDANLSSANFLDSDVTSVTFSNTYCPDNSNSDEVGGTCAGHGLLPG